MKDSGLYGRIYCNAVWAERAYIMWVLTFLYTSFSILFCQKKVKKNCKYVARVFFKKAGMRCEEARGNDAPDVR